MNVRFTNARLLTMANGMKITEGELWVRGERIAYVGPSVNSPRSEMLDREIDLSGNLILPGFKNAHTHSPMTFLRSYADDLPLLDWLHRQVFPREAQLRPGDCYWLSLLAILEYLSGGITANFDMYLHQHEVARATADAGFRTVLCSPLNDFTSSLRQMEEDYRLYNGGDERLSFRLGFHAEYTTSRRLLEGVAELSHRLKAPVWCHSSESESEVRQCVERTGMTPTAYLNALGLYDYGGGGYHCVHMTDEDLQIYREKGLWVVTNPASNVKLASGIAPVKHMLDLGIPVAIGTDGPASNNCLDMFREMYLTAGLQKLLLNDAAVPDANAVLRMAISDGALAMGLPDCDCLAPGKCADLMVIDLHTPNMQPLNNITKNLVYSGSKQNIKLTMVAGRILYEDGRFDIGFDPEEIYAKANEIIGAMHG